MADIDSTLSSLSIEKPTDNEAGDDGVLVLSQGDVKEPEVTTGPTHEAEYRGEGGSKVGGSETSEALDSTYADGTHASTSLATASTMDTLPSGTNTITVAPAPLKRFTPVNINRRFLEKNSSVTSNGTSNLGTSQNTTKSASTTSKSLKCQKHVLIAES
jgi:hypothetical protein